MAKKTHEEIVADLKTKHSAATEKLQGKHTKAIEAAGKKHARDLASVVSVATNIGNAVSDAIDALQVDGPLTAAKAAAIAKKLLAAYNKLVGHPAIASNQ